MKKTNNKVKAHIRYRLKPTEDFLKGRIVPGVTTITGILDKPALLHWAWKLGMKGVDYKKFRDDKADIGTLAHAKIIGELINQAVDVSEYSQQQIDAADNACLSFYEWQKEHKLEVVKAEQALVSEIYEFGGQFDIYGLIDERRELLDLKTGSGIYEEAYYQLGGYLILLAEHNHPVEQVRILNIPRSEDENFQEVILSGRMMDLAKDMFLDCLKIYNRKKEIKRIMKR